MKKVLEVRISILIVIQLNHSISRILITSPLMLMGMFSARNVGKVSLPNYYEHHKGSTQCTKNKKKWKEADVVNRTKS